MKSTKIKVIKYTEDGEEIEKEIDGIKLEIGKKYIQCPNDWMKAEYKIIFTNDAIALGISNKYGHDNYEIFNANNGTAYNTPNNVAYRLHKV